MSGKTRNITPFSQAAVELIATDCVTKISFASLGLRLAVVLDYLLKALSLPPMLEPLPKLA